MENFEIMVILFAIVIIGFVAGKLGYMGGDFDKRLSSLIIDFTCPALILSSTMGDALPDRKLIMPLIGISLLTYTLLTAVALLLARIITKKQADRGIIAFALIFGNVGFIGYPIVASIFGQEAVFYAAMLNVINTLAVFTVGTMLINDNTEQHRFNPKVLYGAPMISAYLSILIVALQINPIPKIISQPLSLVGNITVPAALLIIGSSLSRLSARSMLGNMTVYVTTALRLFILPIGLYFLFLSLHFSEKVVCINTTIIAMPVATYGTILCLKHGRDTTLITELTFISTLLSVVSIPLLTLLF